MSNKTPQQLARIFGLLRTMGIDRAGRAQLVHQFTNGRSSSAADLSYTEADDIIKALEGMAANTGSPKDIAVKMRRRIISLAHEMGWELPSAGKGRPSADMLRLYNWVLKFGYLHKDFNAYTVNELPKLVTQFEEVYKHYLSKVK
jgi:hypothetical protein